MSNGDFTWSPKAVETALNVDTDDSDVLIGTYPKTGLSAIVIFRLHFNIKYIGRNVDNREIIMAGEIDIKIKLL